MNNLTIEQDFALGKKFTVATLSKDFKSEAIYFYLNEKSPLILKEDGFYYNGEHIKDAGEAHRLFVKTMHDTGNTRNTRITAPNPPPQKK